MRDATRRTVTPRGALLGAALFGLLTGGPAWTEEETPADQPMNLLLTRSELEAFVHDYETRTGRVLTAPIDDDEILVRARGMQAPMRDVSQDVWGGIAAPFWAIMNPKDAWRIFVPVPAKGLPQESEPPAPDPR